MSLAHGRVEARLPAEDLARAKRWYAEKLGLLPSEERDGGLRYVCDSGAFCLFTSVGFADGSFTQLGFEVDDIDAEVRELRRRGVVFEDYGIPGLAMANHIVDIPDNYPSKGRAERGAWFRDSEGNMLGLGQAIK
ncbi:VOC family protein [Mycolicibacterium moriokaense]|nr:VOC family protein [Mycolicibacterium moriokaense]